VVLSWRLVLSYAVGAFGQGLLPLIVGSWIMFFYCPPEGEGVVLLSAALLGTIRLVERAVGAFIEPLVGHLSDRTRTRFGRRIPWIAIGLPFLCVSFAAMFFPPKNLPVDDPQVALHFGLWLMIFYASYTAVFAPYSALHPELATQADQRVRLSVWMSLFEVASNVIGSIAAAPLIGLGAIAIFGLALANGFELLALACAVIAFLSVVPVVILVREKTHENMEQFGLLDAVKASLANEAFRGYSAIVFALRVASFSAVIGIPYLATELMQVEASTASYMLAIIIVVATMAFPIVQHLANKRGKARVIRWGAIGYIFTLPLMGTIGLTPIPPIVHGVILFFLAGFSTATLFVLPRPLLADVIDHDEKKTGLRREAMYTGMSGVVEKLGEAVATGAVSYLFHFLGRSASQPLGLRLIGLVGAVALGGGLLLFRRYPLEEA
jgi:glycoside/pentoside/hexuronide:cation symporter, GPH family